METAVMNINREDAELLLAAIDSFCFTEDVGYGLWNAQGGSVGTRDMNHCLRLLDFRKALGQSFPDLKSGAIWTTLDWMGETLSKEITRVSAEFKESEK